MGRKKPTARDDEGPVAAAAAQGAGKSKKKQVLIDDDEYSISTELSEEPRVSEEIAAPAAKKKGKKGNKKGTQRIEDEDDEEEELQEIAFTGKNKSKGKKGGSNSVFSTSNFGLLGDEDNDGEEDEDEKDSDAEVEPVSFTGKKKASKKGSNKTSGSKFSASAFDVLDDDDNEGEGIDTGKEEDAAADEKDDDIPVIEFTGKKKSSKGGKKGKKDVKFSASLLDGDNDEEAASVSGSISTGDGVTGFDDEDEAGISFTGKKKSSKKKGSNKSALDDEKGDGDTADVQQQTGPTKSNNTQVNVGDEVVETSKSKKKKKNKSGRTAQEEDDLDKLLAELGEGPIEKPSAPAPQEEGIQVQLEQLTLVDASGEKEGEDEKEESAAAKKKKKKKEKEKEKKAAATEKKAVEEAKTEINETKKSDAKGKAAEKKVPKHVREMQEAMARRKELEERKAREEEEKRRKEEEERLRLEELERQAEEARRKKKEKEKEKLLKKKLEGKLLTGKQKEEQRRLEAMRNQILANAGVSIPTGEKEGAPTKRPKYQTKKSKQAHHHGAGSSSVAENVEAKENKLEQQAAEPEVEAMEVEKAEVEESIDTEEKQKAVNGVEENGVDEDEDDEEWDAKSWDDVNLNVKGAFDDEEMDSDPETVSKKETKNAAAAAVAAKASLPLQPVKSQDIELKKPQPENEITEKNKKKGGAAKNKMPSSDATPKPGEEDLRSPICCIMGHVDTGKTKLLDCIRGTNVQEGEAGGITQQIGATYFPAENIRERTRELKADAKLKVPGLLVIDTPGHESFTNLRSRGSGLCDIAILVVDIMHGLEPQTIESLNLLKMRNTDFIVALNKVDRLYGWKTCRNAPIVKAMKQQTKDVQNEFNMRVSNIITEFMEQGLNTELYYKNKEMGETFSIVPTSAISGEGIPDLLLLLVQWTQKTMVEKLTFSNEIQCTVLEVKVVEGHGTTIDVVLVNGVLHEGDQIVVCGLQGPIVTNIRALLTPHPMKEIRVKGAYLHPKEIKAAQGIKITAQGLEHAVAGTSLYVVGPDDDVDDVMELAMEDMRSVMSRIDKSGEGVYVQASTLGSLEALLEFLKSPAVKIPVSGIGIGPVHKKDVMKASVMLEKKKEYATILAFDVKVTQEARELADDLGVKIFIADIIYHLFDQFKAYIDNLKEEKKKEAADEVVFPCVLSIMPNCIFNKKDPIILGVDVIEGILKVGTPICVPERDFIDIGRITSIENNHKPVDYAKKGQKVAVKISSNSSEEQQKMFGRHFEQDDSLISRITRNSIDILKANYRDDLSLDDWRLVKKLKTILNIQ
ncbi:eukaryotic translation initiation factor 2 (eIF-2) family protein [Euphorbia peplus]|nr:eukaryotic translation initiation factor 2 (eIF-2) family protein [Euphorbia peplus]